MVRLTIFLRCVVLLLPAVVVIVLGANAAAQYTLTTLVTTSQDPNLINAWGMAYATGGPFWISDNVTGKSTVYDASGTIVPTVVTIPAAKTGAKGSPTGIVANSTSGFVVTQNAVSGPSNFIFASMDGIISGWNPSVNASSAVIAVNNHGTANYTGLTIATVSAGTFIYAANSAKNQIEVYDINFHLVKTFTDATLTGLRVYGVQAIKGRIYVTFQGTSGGAVDVFTPSGTLAKLLTKNGSSGPLLAPWAVALAPANFGTFSNDLLVGNVNNGQIHAINLTTGKVAGTLKDTKGATISVPGLWALLFGGGTATNGNTDQLFFAAGTGNYGTGEFGVINP